jgi:hypothetical protein
VGGNQAVSGNAAAGSFSATQSGPSLGQGILANFEAFCLDLAGNLSNGNFVVNNLNPFQPGRILTGQQVTNVKTLFNASYGLVDNTDRNQSAAFQLALWEVVYEDTTFDLTGGNFTTTTTGNPIGTLATTYIGRMATNPSAFAYNVHFLDAENTSAQDLVTATVVPLPAAGFLLFGAIGALGFTSRRRKVAAEV